MVRARRRVASRRWDAVGVWRRPGDRPGETTWHDAARTTNTPLAVQLAGPVIVVSASGLHFECDVDSLDNTLKPVDAQ